MAHVTKLFMGFEEFYDGYNPRANGSFPGSPGWSYWAKPPNVYARVGVPTLDSTMYVSTVPNSLGINFGTGRTTSVLPEAYKVGHAIGVLGGYTAPFRTNIINATTGGMQIAVNRDYWMGVDAAEVYAQWDFKLTASNVSVTNATFVSTTAMFQWGDVGIHVKSQTYVSTPSSMYTLVLAVYNNGAEIATITLPQQASTNWYYCRAHVKLDGAAGVIEFECNTVTQSVAFATGNSIVTTSVANADWIYIGPPMADDGTTIYIGGTDNFWLGTTGWPSGRPRGFLHTIASDGTLSGWAAEGTTPTTITAALQGAAEPDARAARGSGSGATALLTLSSIATTGLEADLIGYTLIPARVSNRDQTTEKRLSVGMSNGGTHTMGALAPAIQPPLAYNLVPSAEVYVQYIWEGLYIDSAAVAFPSASLHSVRLLTI